MKFLNSPRLNLSNLVFSQGVIGNLPSVQTIYAGSSEEFAGSSDTLAGDTSFDTIKIYSFSSSDYSAAKFLIHVKSSDEMMMREVVALHNGVEGYITEYAILKNSAVTNIDDDTLTFDLSTGGSEYELNLAPSTGDSRSIIVHATGLRI